MSSFKGLLACLVLACTAVDSLVVAQSQSQSLLEVINQALAEQVIEIDLGNEFTDLSGQSIPLLNLQGVFLRSVTCSGIGIGGISLTSSTVQVPGETGFEITAGINDLAATCAVDIATQSCGTVYDGLLTVTLADLDASLQTTAFRPVNTTGSPTRVAPDARSCTQALQIQFNPAVYDNIRLENSLCFGGPLVIDTDDNALLAGLLNSFLVDPLLASFDETLCSSVQDLGLQIGNALLALGQNITDVPSLELEALSAEDATIGANGVFVVPSSPKVEVYDENRINSLFQTAQTDINELLAPILDVIDPLIDTFQELQATLEEILRFTDLIELPTVEQLLELYFPDLQLPQPLLDFLNGLLPSNQTLPAPFGNLTSPFGNSTGALEDVSEQILAFLFGNAASLPSADEIVEAILSLIPGNETFGLLDAIDEIETILTFIEGNSTVGVEDLAEALLLLSQNSSVSEEAAISTLSILIKFLDGNSSTLVSGEELVETIQLLIPGNGTVVLDALIDEIDILLLVLQQATVQVIADALLELAPANSTFSEDAALIAAEILVTLFDGDNSTVVSGDDLVSLALELLPGNETFGLEELADEIDVLLGYFSGRSTLGDVIISLAGLLPENATISAEDVETVVEILEAAQNSDVDLGSVILNMSRVFLPERLTIPFIDVPGLGTVSGSVAIMDLVLPALPETVGSFSLFGRSSIKTPSIVLTSTALIVDIEFSMNVSDAGDLVPAFLYEDKIVLTLTLADSIAAGSILFGLSYDNLEAASETGLVEDPINVASCGASSMYGMSSAISARVGDIEVSLSSEDALVDVLAEAITIFFDLFGGSVAPAAIDNMLYDSLKPLYERNVPSSLFSQGGDTCSQFLEEPEEVEGNNVVVDSIVAAILAPIAVLAAAAGMYVMYKRRSEREISTGLAGAEKQEINGTPNPMANAQIVGDEATAVKSV